MQIIDVQYPSIDIKAHSIEILKKNLVIKIKYFLSNISKWPNKRPNYTRRLSFNIRFLSFDEIRLTNTVGMFQFDRKFNFLKVYLLHSVSIWLN